MPYLLCRQGVSGESSETHLPCHWSLPGLEQYEGREGRLWSGLQSRQRGGSWEPTPAFRPLHAQHQKAVAHLTPQEWAELVLSVQGPVQLVMLEVALTMTKDHLASDFCSDEEETVFWLL